MTDENTGSVWIDYKIYPCERELEQERRELGTYIGSGLTWADFIKVAEGGFVVE